MAKRLSLVLETKRFDFGTSFKVAKVVVAQVDRESLEIAFDDEGVGVASSTLVISIYFQKKIIIHPIPTQRDSMQPFLSIVLFTFL
jgi:hypothetical protein